MVTTYHRYILIPDLLMYLIAFKIENIVSTVTVVNNLLAFYNFKKTDICIILEILYFVSYY